MKQSGTEVNFEDTWNDSIIPKWKSSVYESYQGKIQTRKIYTQEIVEELKDIYEKMSQARLQIKNDNPVFSDEKFMANIFINEILTQVRNVLVAIDERKANNLFD